MKHYRINKVVKPNGPVLKKRDILASSDKEAMAVAESDDDCPVCDVYQAGKPVGSIV